MRRLEVAAAAQAIFDEVHVCDKAEARFFGDSLFRDYTWIFFILLFRFVSSAKGTHPGGIMIGCQVSSSSLYNDAKRLREVGVVVAAARMMRYGQRD